MEKIERELSELEYKSAVIQQTLSQYTSVTTPVSKSTRLLLVLNQYQKLLPALDWIDTYNFRITEISLILRHQSLDTPLIIKPSHVIPDLLKPLIGPISSLASPVTVYALPTIEMTTVAVSLLRSAELVLVAGCSCLSRREYEDVEEFKPLVEEILLKEAVQPVILFK